MREHSNESKTHRSHRDCRQRPGRRGGHLSAQLWSREGQRRRCPALGIRNAFLQIGDAQIELITPLSEQGPVADFLAKQGEGMYLLALEVDNLDDAIATLQSQGACVHVATGSTGQRLAFVSPRATHGVLLQLLERREA